MVGDEESTEFISESMKLQQSDKQPIKESSKRQSINSLIYFGGVLTFMCIIILLFWRVSNKRFHKKDAHLLVISSADLDYFDFLSDATRLSNCTESRELKQENTLVLVSNHLVSSEMQGCIDQLGNKISDKILIVYNATQESILHQLDDSIKQYYLSDCDLDIENARIQKFTLLNDDEQMEVVGQIINNIFK